MEFGENERRTELFLTKRSVERTEIEIETMINQSRNLTKTKKFLKIRTQNLLEKWKKIQTDVKLNHKTVNVIEKAEFHFEDIKLNFVR